MEVKISDQYFIYTVFYSNNPYRICDLITQLHERLKKDIQYHRGKYTSTVLLDYANENNIKGLNEFRAVRNAYVHNSRNTEELLECVSTVQISHIQSYMEYFGCDISDDKVYKSLCDLRRYLAHQIEMFPVINTEGWIIQYKDAILMAAWDAGLVAVGTDEESVSGRDEWPVLRIGVQSAEDKDKAVYSFKHSLEHSLGKDQPFSVVGMPEEDALGMSVILCNRGNWVYK